MLIEVQVDANRLEVLVASDPTCRSPRASRRQCGWINIPVLCRQALISQGQESE